MCGLAGMRKLRTNANTNQRVPVKETTIESALVSRAAALGGHAIKWVAPGSAGVPDRIVVLPGGRIGFLELKAPGKKLDPLQVEWQVKLAALGVPVGWADSVLGVHAFLASLAKSG